MTVAALKLPYPFLLSELWAKLQAWTSDEIKQNLLQKVRASCALNVGGEEEGTHSNARARSCVYCREAVDSKPQTVEIWSKQGSV